MTMTDAELAEIRARVEEAHGTEWIWDGEGGNTDVVDVEFGTHVCTATDIDTAFFISYCKRDIPALLDELAAARKENERLQEAVQAVVNSTELCSAFCHVARAKQVLSWHPAALHSATEDADDRTT